jgi:hypothetical protein
VPNVLSRGALVVLLALSVACAGAGSSAVSKDAGTPDRRAADPRADVCADPSAAAPSYAIVQRIFTENCVTCHTSGQARVNLLPGVSWMDLVRQPAPAPETCGGTLVVPGQPNASYLFEKLSASSPCYGEQMPLSDFGSQPLPDCVVAIVQAWIAEGAPGPDADGGAASD